MNAPHPIFSSLRTLSFVALAVLAAPATPAAAAVIFNNGSPTTSPPAAPPATGALFADAGMNLTTAADDFSLLAGSTTIRDIHWWGVYGSGIASPPADNFTVTIYNNNAGTPGTVNTAVAVSNLVRSATGLIVTDRALYKYDAVVSDISLTAGTTYWLAISNASGGNNWAWAQNSTSGGNAKQFSVSNGTFGNTNEILAFNLTNDIVPEPASVVSLGIGALVAVFAFARRRTGR